MSMSELERFSSDLRSDSALYDSVASKGDDLAGLVQAAQAKGYGITLEEVEKHAARQPSELSDEALDTVAGGRGIPTVMSQVVGYVIVRI